jgi:hypothetical protein
MHGPDSRAAGLLCPRDRARGGPRAYVESALSLRPRAFGRRVSEHLSNHRLGTAGLPGLTSARCHRVSRPTGVTSGRRRCTSRSRARKYRGEADEELKVDRAFSCLMLLRSPRALVVAPTLFAVKSAANLVNSDFGCRSCPVGGESTRYSRGHARASRASGRLIVVYPLCAGFLNSLAHPMH